MTLSAKGQLTINVLQQSRQNDAQRCTACQMTGNPSKADFRQNAIKLVEWVPWKGRTMHIFHERPTPRQWAINWGRFYPQILQWNYLFCHQNHNHMNASTLTKEISVTDNNILTSTLSTLIADPKSFIKSRPHGRFNTCFMYKWKFWSKN